MNRLVNESSPYLRQHADNPVDWYPWGDEAFARAGQEDKPVLLSIGYSACHWCHVMAHQSFENDAVAAVMNRDFVNIKVDREERPDVDAIYMEATQAMTGSGGWPMTVFLAPDRRPFYAGTYFPREKFLQLMDAVTNAWKDHRDDLEKQADDLTNSIKERSEVTPGDADLANAIDNARETLKRSFDPEYKGFGRSPKFPMPTNLEFLLRTGDDGALKATTETLDAMAAGGIYDHLGGGFARYSVDREWLVPHFEKMLYDNALITRPYLHAWQLTRQPQYRQVVEETIGYVLRDLAAPGGGFCSAEDADSEGVEGKFYVWSYDEVPEPAKSWYGVTPQGNFEGATILRRPPGAPLERPDDVELLRKSLFEKRAERIRPGLDDKVLTEWNAMFIATLAEAGAAFDNPTWLQRATTAAEFLIRELRHGDRWRRAWQQEAGARHLAYAVDYAHLVDAFTRLAEATGQARWIAEARSTADGMLDLFWDDAEGGLFTTGADAEELLVRTKDIYDGATPSANSVAALALTRLTSLTGEDRYHDAAARILRLLGDYLTRHPTAVTTALAAADLHANGTVEIVVTDATLVRTVTTSYNPRAVLAWGERYPSPLWEGRDKPAAYVCRNYTCGLPATTPEDLAAQLTAAGR